MILSVEELTGPNLPTGNGGFHRKLGASSEVRTPNSEVAREMASNLVANYIKTVLP